MRLFHVAGYHQLPYSTLFLTVSLSRFITDDLRVICHSLEEYNEYYNFLEYEFMKLSKHREDEMREGKDKVTHFS